MLVPTRQSLQKDRKFLILCQIGKDLKVLAVAPLSFLPAGLNAEYQMLAYSWILTQFLKQGPWQCFL